MGNFFTPDMLSHIIHNTNKKIENLHAKLLLRGHDITSVPYLKNTCSSEILAFIGLLYLRGLLGLNNHDVAILLNDLTGNPVFGDTMSTNRFKFLFSNISFVDFETRTQRWVYDRFTAIKDVFKSFNHNCSSCVVSEIFYLLMKLYIQRECVLDSSNLIQTNQQNMDYYLSR